MLAAQLSKKWSIPLRDKARPLFDTDEECTMQNELVKRTHYCTFAATVATASRNGPQISKLTGRGRPTRINGRTCFISGFPFGWRVAAPAPNRAWKTHTGQARFWMPRGRPFRSGIDDPAIRCTLVRFCCRCRRESLGYGSRGYGRTPKRSRRARHPCGQRHRARGRGRWILSSKDRWGALPGCTQYRRSRDRGMSRTACWAREPPGGTAVRYSCRKSGRRASIGTRTTTWPCGCGPLLAVRNREPCLRHWDFQRGPTSRTAGTAAVETRRPERATW